MSLPAGGGAKWPRDGSMPEHVSNFIDWLLTPEWERAYDCKTQIAYCRHHDISPSSIKEWKRKPSVRKAIQARADELNLSTEKIQEVIEAVHRAAVRGDVKAAGLYLQHADKLAPKRIVIEDKTIAGLTDEELRERLAAAGLLADATD